MDKKLTVESNTDKGYIAYYKNDESFVGSLLGSGKIFETDLVMEHLADIIKNSKVIVDGGGHAGSHTILYKHINPSLEVHCFEPQVRLFELLEHNVSQNNLDNVYLYNLALANKAATATMGTRVIEPSDNPDLPEKIFENLSYGGEDAFNIGGLGIGDDGEPIKTICLDSINLSSCDFIKLDLEGAESIALLGSLETINRFKPAILFEYNHHQLDDSWYKFFEAPRLTPFEILSANGYYITYIGVDNYIAIYGGY